MRVCTYNLPIRYTSLELDCRLDLVLQPYEGIQVRRTQEINFEVDAVKQWDIEKY
jgi:hypothetical protein